MHVVVVVCSAQWKLTIPFGKEYIFSFISNTGIEYVNGTNHSLSGNVLNENFSCVAFPQSNIRLVIISLYRSVF